MNTTELWEALGETPSNSPVRVMLPGGGTYSVVGVEEKHLPLATAVILHVEKEKGDE